MWGAALEARGSQWKCGEQPKATRDGELQVWPLFPVFLEDEGETCPASSGILGTFRCDPSHSGTAVPAFLGLLAQSREGGSLGLECKLVMCLRAWGREGTDEPCAALHFRPWG